MNRLTFYVFLLAFPMGLFAQDEFDAQKYVTSDISGTARYVSMGGAFTALGADPSAVKDNPAGVGVYRNSEVSATVNFHINGVNSMWDGQSGYDHAFKTNINNAAFVLHFVTDPNRQRGLLANNISFAYNRLKTYNRRVNLSSGSDMPTSLTDYMANMTNGLYSSDLSSTTTYDPYSNTNVGWLSVLGYNGYLIDPVLDSESKENGQWVSVLSNGETVKSSYNAYERGSIDEYSVTWGANISNSVYVGAALNVRTISYALTSQYNETFANGGSLHLQNDMYTSGVGLNVALGVIARPIDALRLGFAVQTPSLMRMYESYNSCKLNYSSYDNTNNQSVTGVVSTPTADEGAYSEYDFRTPFKMNIGAAWVFGKRGLVSLEYDFEYYKGMHMSNKGSGTSDGWKAVNKDIKSFTSNVHTLKLGGELMLTDTWALRAGYAYQTAAMTQNATRKLELNSIRTSPEYTLNNGAHYVGAGFGFRNNSWIIDLAYQYRFSQEKWYGFSGQTTAANLDSSTHNIILTFGFR